MKQFLHLMKLQWRRDLLMTVGIFVMAFVFTFISKSMGPSREHFRVISLMGTEVSSWMYLYLFLPYWFTPWTAIFSNQQMIEYLKLNEWIYLQPIDVKHLYHRICLRVLAICIGVFTIVYCCHLSNPDAIVSIRYHPAETIQKDVAAFKEYFPESFTEERRAESGENYTVIVLKNGELLLFGFNALYSFSLLLVLLNIIFWTVPKASRQKVIKKFFYALVFILSLAPMMLMFLINDYTHALLACFKHSLPLIMGGFLCFLVLTYYHGLRVYRYREIE